jgi:hypothetical protein
MPYIAVTPSVKLTSATTKELTFLVPGIMRAQGILLRMARSFHMTAQQLLARSLSYVQYYS